MRDYEEFRRQLARYVDAKSGEESLEVIDAILERLALIGLLDAKEFRGWPENGLVAKVTNGP